MDHFLRIYLNCLRGYPTDCSQKLFAIYREMHDLLGKEGSPMLRLRELQRECL